MAKTMRLFLVMGVMLGLVMLARNSPAWAATPPAGSDQTSLAQPDDSASPYGAQACKRGRDKNMRCRIGNDDRVKKCIRKKDCGTVKPPPPHWEACEKGNYSVGGIAILTIQNLKKYRCLHAYTRSPDPLLDRIPDGSKILSEVIVVQFPASEAKFEICFAAPPGRQVNIYSSTQGSFQLLKTRIKNGMACADGVKPGEYALAGR